MLALALAAQTAPSPPMRGTVEDEIVVIGRRMRTWRGAFRVKRGQLTCSSTRSTGDTALDALGCQSMVACLGPLGPQFDAIAHNDAPKADRQRRFNALLQGQVGCLGDTRQRLVAALAERRRAR